MGVKVRERPEGSGCYWVFTDHQGKRKAKKVGSKKAALDIARKLQQKMAAGDLGLLQKKIQVPLFKDYSDQWHKGYARATCKDSTFRFYEMLLRLHLLPVFGGKRLDEITRADLKTLIVSKINEGLSVSTVLSIRACFSCIYTNAIEDDIVAVNPAQNIGKFIRRFKRVDRRSHLNPLTREEVVLFLEAIRQHFPRYYPLFLCLLRTGMRIGEAVGLQWGDVDFNSRFIVVQRGIVQCKVVTPKNGKSRSVDMSRQLADKLKALLTESKRQALKNGLSEPSPWVFATENGNADNQDNIRHRVFHKCLAKAGLRKIRIHDLRHTYASLLIAQGESLAYIRDQMGHHSIQVTVDIYGHLVPGSNRDAVDKLDSLEPPHMGVFEEPSICGTQQSATQAQPAAAQA